MRKEREGVVVKFFKQEDTKFVTACGKVGIHPTRRQASKWLRQKGKAYKEGR